MTLEMAVREQLEALLDDLLAMPSGSLTRLGISKQRRNYWRKGRKEGAARKLPPTDAVLAGIILLGRRIVIEDLLLPNREGAIRYSIVGVEDRLGELPDISTMPPVQLSLLASLDFPANSTAAIERAERKGPHRVELLLNVEIDKKAG